MTRLARKIILPGFNGVPLFDVTVFFINGLQNSSLKTRASSLSFNFFLALFPAIIFLFTLIPYIPIANFQEQLLSFIGEFLPENAYKTTINTLDDIIHHQKSGLLSFGFIAALYFSTNGVHAMIESFNESYHTTETRSPFKQRLVSIALTFVISFLIFIAISLIIISSVVFKYLLKIGFLHTSFEIYFLTAGQWFISLALIFFAISFLYYFGPVKKIHWRFFSAGSIIATFLIVINTLGFSYYVNNFGNYNKIYGSIGTLIVILLLIYFNSFILLIGFELNASIRKGKEGIKHV